MFSSGDEESVEESGLSSSTNLNRVSFVNAVKGNIIVLNKSLSAKLILEKERAWANICERYEKSVGKKTSVEKLKKMLNNMKTEIKKKTDKNKTGNRTIKLQNWEKDFLSILEDFEKPSLLQIPGASTVGCVNKSSDCKNGLKSSGESPNTTLCANNNNLSEVENDYRIKTTTSIRKSLKRKTNDTEETRHLSIGELQRLVLNEQLKLIRLQMESEEVKLKRIKLKLKHEEKESSNFEVEERHDENISVDEDVTQLDLTDLITFH